MRQISIFGGFLHRVALWPLLAGIIVLAVAAPARAQTPSPLAEWQFSGGIQLARLFEPTVPTWQTELGLAAQGSPLYDGAGRYQVRPGPVIDIRYKDIAFLSTGEGLGANLFSFRHIRFGAAISYDLGRSPHVDGKALSGLGTIHPAPEIKIFADYTLAKAFPVDIRIDARKQIGATYGYIGDVGAYMPMPGSSQSFVWFFGPTVTIADARYMKGYFGISAKQAASTTYKQYKADGGFKSAGVGISASWIITPHVILNADGAFERLLGTAADSPITDARYAGVASIAAIYKF
jgi:outer membrane scaffolding protein for murein synthesis (MipA/OmpV family)